MNRKKLIKILIGVTAIAILSYIFLPGFSKQSMIHIGDFEVAEDGQEMTIHVGNASSIGYVRKVKVHQQEGGKLYLDFYSGFGGLNGSIGAKTEFKIPLMKDTEMIAIYRNKNCYEPVLEKDAKGEWICLTK